MAQLSPEGAFDTLKDRVAESVSSYFPFDGKKHRLELNKVWVEDDKDVDDIRSQKKARLSGRSWTVPVRADVSLVHKDSGRVVNRDTIQVAALPKVTRRYSYIIDGNEWQVDNQFRLKSGVYHRRTQAGELESHWNAAKGQGFRMYFDPSKRKYRLKYGGASNIALYPILKAMGVDDDSLERSWGKKILASNKDVNEAEALRRFHKTVTGRQPESLDEARRLVKDTFDATELRKDTTEATLGKAFGAVSGDALLRSSDRLLKMSRGAQGEDDREALEYKEVFSTEDFIGKRLMDSGIDIKRRLGNNVDRRKRVRDVITPDVFSRPVKSFFTTTSLSQRPDQTNPLEFISGQTRTTVMGEGGISDVHRVTEETKLINPSHLGFLDPIQTPECYAEGTEVYTADGWKDWRHVSRTTRFACRVDGRLEFHLAESLVDEPYRGPMFGLKAGKVEYLVTPNHRVLFNTPWRPDVWRVDRADRVHGKERGFACTHKPLRGQPRSVKTFEPLEKGSNSQVHVDEVDLVDWAEFLGWYLAEGSTRYDEKKYAYHVKISQSKEASPENYERLRLLLGRLPWKYTADDKGFTIGVKQLAEYLHRFGLCDEKYLPSEVYEWPVEAREALLESLLLGDGRIGSKRSDGRAYNQRVFTTTSYALAHGFEKLAVTLGLSVSHKRYTDEREERYLDVREIRILTHGTRWSRPRHPKYPSHHWVEDYNGRVYCATVPGGMLYVRREGSVGFWSGNSGKVGINLHLSLGSEKVGRELFSRVYDKKKGEMVLVGPKELRDSVVAYPDQVRWKNGKPVAVGKQIKVSGPGGETQMAAYGKVRYVLPSAKGLFSTTTNTVPFLPANQGNRASMATRQAEQAISLVAREAPLVQTKTESDLTFEEVLGAFNSHQSPVKGKVVKIKEDAVVVKDKEGKRHEVQMYHDFPLNSTHAYLNSEAIVAVGDEVDRGQTIADTNFTRDGAMALGKNLRVGYLPMKGYNFEDGIVISETAAKKLTSEHMHRDSLGSDVNSVLDKKKFLANMPEGVLTPQQRDKLDDDAVIKDGETVEMGDVLIGGLRRREITKEEKMLGRLSKALIRPYRNEAVLWDKETPGKVVRVTKGKRTTVYVKTQEPAKVGDKMVGRHANKGIITKIVPDHEMPHTGDGAPIEVALNPHGVPCYDEDTEFLTRRGWVFGRELKESDVCGTLDTRTFNFEWQAPEEVHNYPYDGEMYQIQNQQLDLLVTPNHRMFSAKRKKLLGGPLNLGDPEIRACFDLTEAKDVIGEARRYLKAANWEGEDPTFIHVDRGSPGKTGAPARGFNFYSQDWAEFMGWYLAEGSTFFANKGYSYRVEIAQSPEANPENCQRISDLLDRMGVVYQQSAKGFVITHKGLYEKLAPLGGSAEKYIPREILDLPQKELLLFLDAYLHGDGSEVWNEETGHYGTRSCSTNSKKLADGVQEVAIKLGLSANIREDKRHDKYLGGRHFLLSLSGSRSAPWVNWDKITKLHQVEKMTHYRGRVYCVTVPNGVVMVRRNGKHVFCGNSRMNPSQILETAASKIADKTGKTYVVDNFATDKGNYAQKIKDELASHGLTDKETLFDPETKKPIGDVLVGKQYVYKLHHQVDKKMSARAGGVGYPYDVNQVPKGGGDKGAKSLGGLGLYAMLAHGARANVREMMTYKGDRNDELWTAIQAGEPLPPPRPTFAFDKLQSYFKVLGVNTEKQGNSLNLVPLTDKDVRQMSNGELRDAGKMLRGKDLRPERGGLFDPFITGGPGGTKWSHIELPEPMPNPIFEKAVLSLTGLKQADFDRIMSGEKSVDGKTSGSAIQSMLESVDVDKELEAAEARLGSLRGANLDRANKKIKYLRALRKAKLRPTEAYMSRSIPVLPPVMRPVTVLDNGNLNEDDINELYKQVALTSQKFRTMDPALPDEEKNPLRAELYDELKALTVNGATINRRHYRGVMEVLTGDQPKFGFFQDKITARKQDMSLRSTIVPEPSLGLDEVGLPLKGAMGTYSPFVVQHMSKRMGFTPLAAQKAVKARTPAAVHALEQVMSDRPVLLKRDPALHKFGIMAFKPKIVSGKAIQIHPLVTGGFNADFDGDQMNAYVPLSTEAVEEARRMYPSNNLFSDTTGKVMHTPSMEAILGLYDLTTMGRRTNKSFDTEAAITEALKEGDVEVSDKVKLRGKTTTPGRVRVASSLPGGMSTRDKVLYDEDFILRKGNVAEVFADAAKNSKGSFGKVADELKDMGNKRAYEIGATMGLDDIMPYPEDRDRILANAAKRVSSSKKKDKDQVVRDEYARAMDELYRTIIPKMKKNNSSLWKMMDSKSKGNPVQVMQMVAGPVLVKDPQNNVVPFPITTGFSEGMDISDYWAHMHGVRKGATGKVLSTQEPGSMTKNVINTTMNQLIKDEDCGTDRGVSLAVGDREVMDRFLAVDVTLRKGEVVPRGTLVTPDVVSRLKNSKKQKVLVRSPLKCEHGEGMCSKCYGLSGAGTLHTPGANVGVLAAQAVGEPSTQLALNTFHLGGAATAAEARGQQATDKFARVQQILNMPKKLPGAAVLSTTTGKVNKVRKDPAGGHEVFVEDKRHYVPKDTLLKGLRSGAQLKKGQRLSSGPVNPHELLELTNIDTVRNYLTDEMYEAYKGSGPVKRRNMEVIVRSLTNLTEVRDPGDHPGLLRGDVAAATEVAAWNRKSKGRPVVHRPRLKGVKQVPQDLFEDWVARLQHTKLKSTIIDAANQGWTSDIHGMHPIPAAAYGAEFGKAKADTPGFKFVY